MLKQNKVKTKLRESVHKAYLSYGLTFNQVSAVIVVLSKKYRGLRPDYDVNRSSELTESIDKDSDMVPNETPYLPIDWNAVEDGTVLEVVNDLDNQLEVEIKEKSHKVLFDPNSIKRLLEKKKIHSLFTKAGVLAHDYDHIEQLYRQKYGSRKKIMKITKDMVAPLANTTKKLNEAILTHSVPDYRENALSKAIASKNWVQKCLRSSPVPRLKWEINIDMSFFRSLILTAYKYGKQQADS